MITIADLIEKRSSSSHEGLKVTSLELIFPNHPIVMAINGAAINEYPCPGIFIAGGFLPLTKLVVNPDGRILEGRPRPQFDGCHGAIVYEGTRQGEEYHLSFYPVYKVIILSWHGNLLLYEVL